MKRASLHAVLWVAAGALAVGFAAGAWWRAPLSGTPAPDRPAEAPPEPGLRDELARLQTALDAERSLRGALELEAAVLRRELGDVTRAGAGAGEPTSPDAGASHGDADATSPPPLPAGAAPTAAGDAPAQREDWFDVGALLELGVDAARGERLRQDFDDLQMDELYLRDQAARTGTLGRPAYFMQVQDLRSEARKTLGDEDYDLMLYASGRNNRVRVQGLLESSPAALAGMEAGDIVLRYDDVPILAPVDLTDATAQGKSGSSVALDVLRGDTSVRLYLPRGPLGAQIVPVRQSPSP